MPDKSWMLYHRTREPQVFYSLEDRQAAIDSGQWRDVHEEFAEVDTPTYTKHQLSRMNSEARVEILYKYSQTWPEMSREEEIATILELQGDK